MGREYILILGFASMLLACSESENFSHSYSSYGNPENCWKNGNEFAAYVAVYDLGNGDYTFDFISKRCKPKDFEIGQPPSFVVSFLPSKEGAELQRLGIAGNLLPNQISPLPSVHQITGVYSIEGSAKLENSETGQLRISELEISNSNKLDASPVDFLREHLL